MNQIMFDRGKAISTTILLVLLLFWLPLGGCNSPPRFVGEGGGREVVLRLREGEETPVGSRVLRLRGNDADSDALTFGVRPAQPDPQADVLRVQRVSDTEADLFLSKPLDREVCTCLIFFLLL